MPPSAAITFGPNRIVPEAGPDRLWRIETPTGLSLPLAPPRFQVDGRHVTAGGALRPSAEPISLPNGSIEHRLAATLAQDDALTLQVVFRVAADCPVVRFKYILRSDTTRRLTKDDVDDDLTYLSLPVAELPDVTEVRFSQFSHLHYSYMLREIPLRDEQFAADDAVFGPMLVAANDSASALIAYEHGSTVPDAYLQFRLSPHRSVSLHAVKGNYFRGQAIAPGADFHSVWFQAAAVEGAPDDLAAAYRDFVLRYQSQSAARGKPYIFYNTWGRQNLAPDRPTPSTLDTMTETEILREIDVAGRMGIEVFVIDAGWFDSAGLWDASDERFPNGLSPIQAALDQRDMQLGLWQSTQVGTGTDMYREYRNCVMSWRGDEIGIWSCWETRPSQHMCLVSRYADALAERTIELVRETGATYFKWDAFGHYGCDLPGHDHGDDGASVEDRAAGYAFLFDRTMQAVADTVCDACPDVIIDFDITEPLRNVGLGFLASGKYFLINDGPYPNVYDHPPGSPGIFAFPGAARTWECRAPLTFDKWIPSACFLTHYRPDDPAESQTVNIASLVLGQHGIWGDICSVSDDGIALFARLLGLYKQVRDDATSAGAVITGGPGESPEIYEKIAPGGRGVVSLFGNLSGPISYVTARQVSEAFVATDGAAVERLPSGHARITSTARAAIVFFGARESSLPCPTARRRLR